MSASFFRPECLEPPVVLKLRLQRFTLGHFLQFCELDSPYRPDAPRFDSGGAGFMIAVLVCSQPQGAADQILTRWWFRLFLAIWLRACRKLNLADEMRKFRDYINGAIVGPDVTPRGECKQSECPPVYCLLRFLMEDLHQSWDMACAMPLDRIMNIRAAHLERLVGINTWDERREALWRHAIEQAKIKEGRNGAQ